MGGVDELSVLGPIEVDIPPIARRCLAALALYAPRAVSVDQLVAMLWGEEPPTTAHKSLQNAVVAIRRALGHDTVVRRGSGYQLKVPLDRDRFERLAREGAAAEALALWRGDPWQELDSPVAIADAARLRGVLERVEEDVVEQHLDVPTAERVVLANPLSERRWMLLMRAFYRHGRQAEALRAAAKAAEALAQVGLVPTPAFADLERAIATHDPTLGPRQANASALEREARRNGMAALHSRRYVDAARWLRLAGTAPDVLVALGQAQFGAGEAAAARATFLAAIESGEPDRIPQATAAACVGLAAVVSGPGDRELANVIERVGRRLRAVEGHDDVDHARASAAAALAEAKLYTAGVTAPIVEAALAQARATRDDMALGTALKAACLAAARPRDAERQLELAAELAAVSERLGDEEGAATALCTRRQAELQIGAGDGDGTLAQIRGAATATTHAAARAYYELWSAGGPIITGDLPAADLELARYPAAMAGYVGDVAFIHAVYPSYLFTVRWMQGRLPELVPLLESSAEAMPELPTWRSALAMARAAAGDRRGAALLARELLAVPLEASVTPTLWAATTWHLAHTISLIGDVALADQLLPQLEPVATRHATFASIYLGSYAHLVGLLHVAAGRPEDAVASLDRAIEAHRVVGAAWWEHSSLAALHSVLALMDSSRDRTAKF